MRAVSWIMPALLLTTTAHARPWPELTFTSMSTPVRVVVAPGDLVAEAFEVVRTAFAEVEATANEWRPGSPLAAVNQAAGNGPVVVPDDLLLLLERSVALGAMTDGAFDVTWAALWPLWRFTGEGLAPPSPEAVADAVKHIDYRRVVIDKTARTFFLPERGMALGLGGIAKGAALDRAGARLVALGVDSFLIDAGGQVLARGTHNGVPWRIGLRDPRGHRSEVFATLPVSDQSVSTSGDYERSFMHEGVRYHHLLDPRTGWPSRGLLSATVVASDATLADALSTAFMVLGSERSLALARELTAAGTPVGAVLVDPDRRVHATPELRAKLGLRVEGQE